MKHGPILGKFLSVMGSFGLLPLGHAFYSSSQLSYTADVYSDLLTSESTSALYLARANRNMQSIGALIAELAMVSNPDERATTLKNIDIAKKQFQKQIDKAISENPESNDLFQIKTSLLEIFNLTCAPAMVSPKAILTQDAMLVSQTLPLTACKLAFEALGSRFTTLIDKIVGATEQQSRCLGNRASKNREVMKLSDTSSE